MRQLKHHEQLLLKKVDFLNVRCFDVAIVCRASDQLFAVEARCQHS